MKSFTAIIRKGENQFVAICPEIDIVSQGYSIEEASDNLKEAVELYIEEIGVSEDISSKDTIILNFEVKTDDKAPKIIR